MVMGLERQLAEHRAGLTHVDATMGLFDPQLRPEDSLPDYPWTGIGGVSLRG